MSWLSRWFPGAGHGPDEVARRLDVTLDQLEATPVDYQEFTIPKRSGGSRRIAAPAGRLKSIQRRMLRRRLGRLRAHDAAHGFERDHSIVTNARRHEGQAVVMRFDIRDFFAATRAKRVRRYFRRVGWNRPAADLLTRLCTHQGGLPAGAPTSPRLSNLVNHRLDARLAAMAARLGAVYTRYADDITFSLPEDDHAREHYLARFLERVTAEAGYRLHRRKKRSVRRRHHQQRVTGLVVNRRVGLPRSTRRWLRAVDHRAGRQGQDLASGGYRPFTAPPRDPTLSASQREGWRALQTMIERQRG